MVLDDRYLPTAIVLPFEGHARQFLHKDGYLRIAPEVYMRIVHNNNNIYMVADEPDYQEKVVGTNSLYKI